MPPCGAFFLDFYIFCTIDIMNTCEYSNLQHRAPADGVVFDADWNAAANIVIRANHPFSNLPLDGSLKFLDGRALSTARPMGA